MTIEYIGKNNEYYMNRFPLAMISYDENKETEKAERVCDALNEMGYVVECDEEIMTIEISGKDEYNQIVKEYKKIKKN